MEPLQKLFSDNPRKVVILTKENCQFCTKSIDYLKYLGVEPILENIDEQTMSETFQKLCKDYKSLPRYVYQL